MKPSYGALNELHVAIRNEDKRAVGSLLHSLYKERTKGRVMTCLYGAKLTRSYPDISHEIQGDRKSRDNHTDGLVRLCDGHLARAERAVKLYGDHPKNPYFIQAMKEYREAKKLLRAAQKVDLDRSLGFIRHTTKGDFTGIHATPGVNFRGGAVPGGFRDA